MHRTIQLALLLLLAATATQSKAQFDIEDSHTTANLRGVSKVGGGVVWASGENGTVRRSEDEGYLWQLCTTPPGAEKLDFRAIQAFDANTAIVMSSGKGNLSRLYKTTDGCQTWKLLFTNPDKEGFWDAIHAADPDSIYVLGDAVAGKIQLWSVEDNDDPEENKLAYETSGLKAEYEEASFAASNSILIFAGDEKVDPVWQYRWWWASDTPNHSYVTAIRDEHTDTCEPCIVQSTRVEAPMSQGTSTAGIFSLAFHENKIGIAVGGDFKKPDSPTKVASYSIDSGQTWYLSQTPPHGYRSAVAYEPTTKTWITVGPNGTDISTDNGRNWRALKPNLKDSEAPDADKNWNALSLPFVVGPHGRIGKLRTNDLKP